MRIALNIAAVCCALLAVLCPLYVPWHLRWTEEQYTFFRGEQQTETIGPFEEVRLGWIWSPPEPKIRGLKNGDQGVVDFNKAPLFNSTVKENRIVPIYGMIAAEVTPLLLSALVCARMGSKKAKSAAGQIALAAILPRD
jgi:hypothetical protein